MERHIEGTARIVPILQHPVCRKKINEWRWRKNFMHFADSRMLKEVKLWKLFLCLCWSFCCFMHFLNSKPRRTMSLNWCRACNSSVEPILMRKILAITLRWKCISSPYIIFAVTTFRFVSMRHVANRERRMQFSFTSLVISNYFAPTHKLEISKDCMKSIHFLFCAFWKAWSAFWCGAHSRGWKNVNCRRRRKLPSGKNAREAEISAMFKWIFERQWVGKPAHVCAPAKKFFVLHFVYGRFKSSLVSRPSLFVCSVTRDYARRGFGVKTKAREEPELHERLHQPFPAISIIPITKKREP